jgi:hypothetical protein
MQTYIIESIKKHNLKLKNGFTKTGIRKYQAKNKYFEK